MNSKIIFGLRTLFVASASLIVLAGVWSTLLSWSDVARVTLDNPTDGVATFYIRDDRGPRATPGRDLAEVPAKQEEPITVRDWRHKVIYAHVETTGVGQWDSMPIYLSDLGSTTSSEIIPVPR